MDFKYCTKCEQIKSDADIKKHHAAIGGKLVPAAYLLICKYCGGIVRTFTAEKLRKLHSNKR